MSRRPVAGSVLSLPLPRGFDLVQAVCSYGYFILAPNVWDGDARSLRRPLRGDDGRVVHVRVTQPRHAQLRIACDGRLSRGEAATIKRQAVRMLRIDEDLGRWFAIHPTAKRRRFGRLFRSPTLFEDIVKTFTGCNVTWRNTMNMNRLLCERVPAPESRGAFPTPGELAKWTPAKLKNACKVGYRADRIIRLARDVHEGRLDLSVCEDPTLSFAELSDRLRNIHGVGPYAAANLCQLLGRYDRVAIDTETYRHFCKVHQVQRPRGDDAIGLRKLHDRIDAHYARYAPYQFLAYWFELWRGYEDHFGHAHAWDAARDGPNFTAAVLR